MDLILKENNLPSTIEELSKFVLIGREKLTSVRAEIRAIDKLELAKDVREQKKQEAQDLAGALLDAEARLGELFKKIPKETGGKPFHKSTIDSAVDSKKTKNETIKELGFNQKQAERFETLAENKSIIEQVKAEAIENDDIPTRTEVLRKIQQNKIETRNNELKNKNIEMPDDIFDVIYIDPPWQYSNSGFIMSAENKYPTMSIQEMKEKIKFKTNKNAVMFMWVTNPILEECFELINFWNFKYKTNFVWTKSNHTAGFYVFGQHELLLICVKGDGMLPNEKFKSIIIGENIKHSKKPELVYEIIEKMYPNKRYLEIFARNKRENWEVFGNQCE